MAELTDLQNELLKKILAASEIIDNTLTANYVVISPEIIKTISVFYEVSDDESVKIIENLLN